MQQRPIAIGAIQQLSVWDQSAKVLQHMIEQALSRRGSAADGLTAADQHTKLSAALELEQHLIGSESEPAWMARAALRASSQLQGSPRAWARSSMQRCASGSAGIPVS